jgi:hypothetical protein
MLRPIAAICFINQDMIDHKISVQRFNMIEWKASLLTIMNNIPLCDHCNINQAVSNKQKWRWWR